VQPDFLVFSSSAPIRSHPLTASIQSVLKIRCPNRSQTGPFDVVVNGQTAGMGAGQLQERFLAFEQAGLTWWVEGLWDKTATEAADLIRQVPPIMREGLL
jgi:hypothetical protein